MKTLNEQVKEQIKAEIDKELRLLKIVEESHKIDPCYELFAVMCLHMRKIKQLTNELAGY